VNQNIGSASEQNEQQLNQSGRKGGKGRGNFID